VIEYCKNEFRKLIAEIKTLDFKTNYIFISVSVIVFVSIVFATPMFYYDHIGKDRLMSRIYWLLSDGLVMFILSVFSIKFVLKGRLSDYGFTFGDKKFGFTSFLIFFLFMLPILWVASASQSFANMYPQGGSELKTNLSLFVLYELCVLVYMLGWEFLWRGYMLFGLKIKLGYYAVFVQMIPFFILHRGKPDLELFASIFAGIVLGIQALRSNSFFYCWLLHSCVMVSIDTISIIRYSTNFYGIF
jgi:uncharacterized protein